MANFVRGERPPYTLNNQPSPRYSDESTKYYAPSNTYKLANERDRLQRPESEPSDNGYENQVKLQQAMLRRQELLDRIRQEQQEDRRPRTYTPRRRYTPSPLPPPSRRSLPDINHRTYHFGVQNPDMSQVKHVIEHQFRPAPPQQNYQLPPIQAGSVPALTAVQAVAPAEVVPVQPIQQLTYPAAYSLLPVDSGRKQKDTMFNKADFMDMMMLQNAQMHHMVMQQMMLHQLPGGNRPNTYPVAEPFVPVMRAPPSVYHHHINSQPYQPPPMDYRGMGGNYGGMARTYNGTIYDDGSNYYHYH